MNRIWFWVCWIALTGFAGCSGIQKAPPSVSEDSTEYQTLLASLVHRNESLKAFKGIGQANIRKDEKKYVVRLAWAGAEPGKLRVEMIGAPGQAKMGFSSDGEWVYYTDPRDSENPVKKISAKNPNLKNFLSIPVSANDIVTFLSGRIPDYEPHRIRFRQLADGKGYVMVLEKEWWKGARQEIFLDSGKREIEKIESYKAGVLMYRIEFPKMQTVKEYRVPSVLIISDNDGGFFKLNIDRYWANVALSPELFILKPPGKKVPKVTSD